MEQPTIFSSLLHNRHHALQIVQTLEGSWEAEIVSISQGLLVIQPYL